MPSGTRRRLERAALPRSGAMFGSLALHAALQTGGAAYAEAQFAVPPRAPVAFAVLESQPSHAAPERPPCEVHSEPCEQENVVTPCDAAPEPAAAPATIADHDPPPRPPHAQLATRRVVPPVAKAEPKPTPEPPPPAAEPAPTDAPTAPSAGASVAQPEVLVPVPGENPSPSRSASN